MRDVRLLFLPDLRDPVLIAGAPGTADVGLRTASYLKNKLKAELFAEIRALDPFIPPYEFSLEDGVVILKPFGVEEEPENKFYWGRGEERDIIFFIGNAHPLPGKGLDFARRVVDFAQHLGVRRLYIPGAFVADVSHRAEPAIFGMASDYMLVEFLKRKGIPPAPPINFAYNLLSWLLAAAMERGMEVVGLLAEIPKYTTANLKACRALARALTSLLDLSLDLSDLDPLIAREEEEIERWLEGLRDREEAGEFLRYIESLEAEGEPEPLTEKDKEEIVKDIEEFFR